MSRNLPNAVHQKFSTLKKHRHRRGAVLLLTVFLLIALFGMVAFSVDVAYMHLTRAKLRSAVDAAARAASETLSRTNDVTAARTAAQNVALANHVAGEPLILDDTDVLPGAVAINPTGAWTFSEGGTPTNGVRVTGRRVDGSASGPVNLFFWARPGRVRLRASTIFDCRAAEP
jgi:Flp pilus assembly protein TadG